MLPGRHGTNEDDIVDKLSVFSIEVRRGFTGRASSKLVEAGSIEPRRSSSGLGRSSLVEARRGWVGRASSRLVEAGSIERPSRPRTPEARSWARDA